jgi:hypothetical protein
MGSRGGTDARTQRSSVAASGAIPGEALVLLVALRWRMAGERGRGTGGRGRTVGSCRRAVLARILLLFLAFACRNRLLVLRPHIAALDVQGAVRADADKDAGTRDLRRIVDNGPLLEFPQRRLDLAQARVDLLRDLIGVGVFLLQLVQLRLEGIACLGLLLRQRHLLAAQPAQPVRVAVGEVGSDLDPLPSLVANGLRFPLQLRGDEPVEQRRVLQPAAVVGLEQVAQHDAAGGLVVGDADEPYPPVGGAHRVLGEHAADLVRLPHGDTLQRLPHLLCRAGD